MSEAPVSSAPAPAPAAAPAEPYDLRQGLRLGAVAVLLGITQGLSVNLVASNLTAVQGSLGATAAEASWLTTAYFATNISATMLLAKVRYQFGLRRFADVAIAAFLVLSLVHLFTQHLGSAVAMRAAIGLAAAPLSSLAVLYMVQAFPPVRAIFGLVLGFAVLQMGMPLSRIIAGDLLDIGQVHGLHLLEAALALLSAAAINAVRLRPSPTQQMFARGDGVVFVIYAASLALLCVVLTQGRTYWWSDTPWIGLCLAATVVLFGLYVAIELQREKPLIDLRWLASPFMLRFMGAMLLFRVVLSEQSVGAVGLMNQLGFNNSQMHVMFMLVAAGTLVGFLAVLLVVPSRRFGVLGDIALVLIMVAAWMDGQSTVLTRPHDLYLSQTILAAASAMFLASAMLQGFMNVIAGGMKNLVSFIAVFTGGQALAGLVGQAWLTTLLAERQRFHYAHLVENIRVAEPQVAQHLAQLGGAYASSLNDGSARAGQALALLGQQVSQQSFVLAYNDLFHAVAAIATLGFLVFAGSRTHRWHRTRRASAATPLPTST
ncbi:MAG: transporter [Variovorax sp.]|nr:MAG: transporter [Variovorax sp.]